MRRHRARCGKNALVGNTLPRIIKGSYVAIEARPGRACGRDELLLYDTIARVQGYSVKILSLSQNFPNYSDLLTRIINDVRRFIPSYCSLGSCFDQ